MAGYSNAPTGGGAKEDSSRDRSEERLSGAKQDLFELLERVQCSRIDDQRCVLPSKLSQVGCAGR